jgi:hypothetical protein
MHDMASGHSIIKEISYMTTFRFLARGGMIALALAAVLTGGAQAQTMSSTAELKLACETSPNNTVTLTNNTQISTGPQAPLTETVNTKCTIVLNPQVTFEASQVSMTFNGALSIQASTEGRALFTEASFTARSVSVSLGSLGGLLVERSLLQSTVGGISVTSGTESVIDVRGPIVGGGLVSNAGISMSGGNKFFATLTDAEVRANNNVTVNLNGVEGQLISTNSTVNSANGAVNITGSSTKAFVEFKLGAVATGRNGVNVTVSGAESTINASEFTLSSAAAGVFLRANGGKGKVTLAQGTISSGTVTTIQAGVSGTEGAALLQNATVNAGGNFRLETGSLGNSEAVDNTLTSNTLVRKLQIAEQRHHRAHSADLPVIASRIGLPHSIPATRPSPTLLVKAGSNQETCSRLRSPTPEPASHFRRPLLSRTSFARIKKNPA